MKEGDLSWLIEALPAGVWVGSVPDGNVTFTNATFERIMGTLPVPEADITAAPQVYGIFDRTGRPYPIELLPFSQVVATKSAVEIDDIVIHRPDGQKIPVRAFGQPSFDAQGNLSQVVIAFFDISREVHAEQQRQETEARLRFAVNNAPIVVWTADTQGTILLSEGAGLSALGMKSGQLVGQNVFDLYRQHPTIPSYIRRGLAGESLRYVVEVGEAVYDTHLMPIYDANGVQIGISGLSHDVSELRKLQSTMIQNDRVIALGTLAASVAHEINNPLTYMLGHSERLRNALIQLKSIAHRLDTHERDSLLKLATKMQEMLDPICTGTQRIATITGELRSFSRSDDNDSAPVDPRAVVRSVLQLIEKEVEAQVRLTLDLLPTRPVLGNSARLAQVVLNLVVNATQALSDHNEGKIMIRTFEDDDHAVVEVSDNGPGVQADVRDRIFEPFISTKDVGAGTGLGLFVSRNIARNLGGDLIVYEHPGGGATFRVTLPCYKGPLPEDTSRLPASPIAEGASEAILVVDDDERVGAVLCARLESAGYRARRVQTGEEALELLLEQRIPFALVFCDLMMRGFTGMDLGEVVRERAPELLPSIVFMTGGAFTPRAQAFLSTLPTEHVEKPFDIAIEAKKRLLLLACPDQA